MHPWARRMLLALCFDNSQKSQGAKACIASSLGLPDHTDINRHTVSALDREVAKTKSGTTAISLRSVSRHQRRLTALPSIHKLTHTHPAITDDMGQGAGHAFAYHRQLLAAALKSNMQSGKKEVRDQYFGLS